MAKMELLTQKQLRIIELFRKNPFAEYTIREIAKKIGNASYSWTYNMANKMIKENILKSRRTGASIACSINLDEPMAVAYLSLMEEAAAFSSKVPNHVIERILRAVPTPYFTLLVAGSYAKGTQTEKSDIDVIVITDEISTQRVMNYVKHEAELSMPEAHPYVFKKSEFLAMLLDKKENYGKEAFRNRLIFHNPESYYSILREAVAHGFRG
ncbi:MAG: nucleotidyltransferase domain-containing protein [Nanoarchaeota archaeon]|nr:nucleotidyltransferase domain-containing protein [Nanoarchaeota archaeon]